MLTRSDSIRSHVILSVRVIHAGERHALVVTESPALARAIGDHLRAIHRGLAVIWMPSVSGALRRLESDRAEIVVVDETLPSSGELMASIQAESPEISVVALAGEK